MKREQGMYTYVQIHTWGGVGFVMWCWGGTVVHCHCSIATSCLQGPQLDSELGILSASHVRPMHGEFSHLCPLFLKSGSTAIRTRIKDEEMMTGATTGSPHVDNYMFNNTLCCSSAKWYKIACWEVAL